MGELDRIIGITSFEISEEIPAGFANRAESLRSEIRLFEEKIQTTMAGLQDVDDESVRSLVTEELNLIRFQTVGSLASAARELIDAAQNYREMEQAESLYYRATALEPRADEIDVRHRYSN